MEIRPLTEQELNELIKTAPLSETKFVRDTCSSLGVSSFEFFERCAKESSGLLNGRPLYFWAVVDNSLWTIVNSDVKEQFTLYKVAKRESAKLAEKLGYLKATMYRDNDKNLEWTKRLGFRAIEENDKIITLQLKKRS